MVTHLEGLDRDAIGFSQLGKPVMGKVEGNVDLLAQDTVRQRLPIRKLFHSNFGTLLIRWIVDIGDQLNLVFTERLDHVRARVQDRAAVVEVDDEDPFGEDGVHNVGGTIGCNPYGRLIHGRHNHVSQRGVRGGVLFVEFHQTVGNVLSVDGGTVRERVFGFQHNVPDKITDLTDGFCHLTNNRVILVHSKEFLGHAVTYQRPSRTACGRIHGGCQKGLAHYYRTISPPHQAEGEDDEYSCKEILSTKQHDDGRMQRTELQLCVAAKDFKDILSLFFLLEASQFVSFLRPHP